MRSYEKLASLRYDAVVLDKLTMDPFVASKKIMSNEKEVNSILIAREMFYTTFWGNLIAFMADYSVHQVILCYGYYVYVRRKRQQQATTLVKDAVVVDASEKGLSLFFRVKNY